MKKFIFHLLFLVIVLGELAGEIFMIKFLEYTFKPLIMIWIGGYFLLFSKQIDKKLVRLALGAFIFSWLGDVFLMFDNKAFIWFVLGLSDFLAAQIFYSVVFLRTIKLSGKKSFLKKQPHWLIAYIIYGLIVYILIFPQLNLMLKVSVFMYMVAILGMSAMALNRFGNGHPLSFGLVFTGSVLFVISNTLIAVNRFFITVPIEGVWVISAYIGAQYLIMRGLLMQYE